MAKSMTWFYLIILLFVLSGMWASVVFAAEYEGYDEPYYIYKGTNSTQQKDIFYCTEWETGQKVTQCWSKGMPFECVVDLLETTPPALLCVYDGD